MMPKLQPGPEMDKLTRIRQPKAKTLIVPDVHERIGTLRRILANLAGPDTPVVFLGDWFDSFDGVASSMAETIGWLNDNTCNPLFTFLWGNHDLHYAYQMDGLRCSWYSGERDRMIRAAGVDFGRFQFSVVVDGWLCTHAGVHPSLLPALRPGRDAARLHEQILAATAHPWVTVPPILQAGYTRGGRQPVGGITWLDWEAEFEPIPGIFQIVGHSEGDHPREKISPDSRSICIDARLRSFLWIDDGKCS